MLTCEVLVAHIIDTSQKSYKPFFELEKWKQFIFNKTKTIYILLKYDLFKKRSFS